MSLSRFSGSRDGASRVKHISHPQGSAGIPACAFFRIILSPAAALILAGAFILTGAVAVSAGESASTALDLKTAVIDGLQPLETVNDRQAARFITRARQAVLDSVERNGDSLFVTGSTIVPPPDGLQVFNSSRLAINWLGNAQRRLSDPALSAVLTGYSDDIVESDRILARTILDMVTHGYNHTPRSERLLAEAEALYAAGIDADDGPTAVAAFRQAWQRAYRAMGLAEEIKIVHLGWARKLYDPANPVPSAIAINHDIENVSTNTDGTVTLLSVDTEQWSGDNMAGSRSWAGNTLVGAPGRNYRLGLDFWDIREGGPNALGEWGYFPRMMQDAQWRFGYLAPEAANIPVEHGTNFGLDSALPADAIVVCLPFRLWVGSGDAVWQDGWYRGNPLGAGVWQVQAGQSIAQAQQELTNRIGRLDFLKDVTPEEMPVFQLQVGDSGHWELLVDIDRNGEIDIDVTSTLPGNRPSDYTTVTQAGGLWITTGAAGGIRSGRVGRSPMTISYAETSRETVPATPRDRRPLEVAIPDSSIVSPVTVEGRRWNANYRVFQEASTLPETREVEYLDAHKFISTVPLSAETAAQVSYTQDCTPPAVKEGAIAWQALDLSDPATAGLLLSLRVGETVLLTASGSGSLLQIDINGTVFTGVPGQLFTYTAGAGGTHTATAWIDGEETGSLEIAVVEVTLPERILCQVGKTVQAVVELGPGVDFDDFTFTAADPALLDVSVKTNRGSRVELNLRARQRGTPVFEVRRKADNSLVAAQEVEEFILENSSQYSLRVNPVTRTGYVTLTFKPLVTNIVVSMNMFASQATFGGGLTEYIMTDVDFIPVWNPETEEYEAFGEFAIELPSWENYYCYNVTVLGIPSNYEGTIAELLGGEGDKAGGGHINADIDDCCEPGETIDTTKDEGSFPWDRPLHAWTADVPIGHVRAFSETQIWNRLFDNALGSLLGNIRIPWLEIPASLRKKYTYTCCYSCDKDDDCLKIGKYSLESMRVNFSRQVGIDYPWEGNAGFQAFVNTCENIIIPALRLAERDDDADDIERLINRLTGIKLPVRFLINDHYEKETDECNKCPDPCGDVDAASLSDCQTGLRRNGIKVSGSKSAAGGLVSVSIHVVGMYEWQGSRVGLDNFRKNEYYGMIYIELKAGVFPPWYPFGPLNVPLTQWNDDRELCM